MFLQRRQNEEEDREKQKNVTLKNYPGGAREEEMFCIWDRVTLAEAPGHEEEDDHFLRKVTQDNKH